MFSIFKPISISLSPNVEKDDIILALKLIFQPRLWKNGKTIKEFEEQFKKYLGVKYALSFNSGRSALYAILKSLNLPAGSHVFLQAFTCNAVPNPILWAGLNPVYVDCRNDFNIDVEDLKRKITLRHDSGQTPKALVVQHTFGLPADMDEINIIMRQHNLTLIEDCAHSLGADFNDQTGLVVNDQTGLVVGNSAKVGTFSKAAFFSFSRDKVISSVYGGMAVTNDDAIGEKLEKLQREFGQPSYFWIFQQILHPLLLNLIILPIYNFLNLGKIFLIFSQWLHILSKAVSFREKRGLKPDYFPKALPNVLAIMAKNQFNKLDKFNSRRREIAEFYYSELKNTKFILPQKNKNIFLRFTLQHPKAHQIIYEAWHQENILLGDWYTNPIAPDDTQLDKIKYTLGSCPNVEKLSKTTLNLPTHINISRQDVQRIINFLKKFIR